MRRFITFIASKLRRTATVDATKGGCAHNCGCKPPKPEPLRRVSEKLTVHVGKSGWAGSRIEVEGQTVFDDHSDAYRRAIELEEQHPGMVISVECESLYSNGETVRSHMSPKHFSAQARLSYGAEITIDGRRYAKDGDGEVRPGDLYVAERNTGAHLLTCKSVSTKPGTGWVNPENGGTTCYPFDLGECIRVREVFPGNVHRYRGFGRPAAVAA